MSTAPEAWTVVARNLAQHATNPIHTDEGATAAGFPRALVAGVTTYAYLTHPIVAAWGEPWIEHGGGEVRFRRPVFDRDLVRCLPTMDDDECVVEAHTDGPEQPRAVFRAVHRCVPVAMRTGEELTSRRLRLDGDWGADYGTRAGDDLALYVDRDVVHPAVWPSLANHIVHTQVARGSWIHLRSIVRHHGLASGGTTVDIRSVVVRRFESHGERALLDVWIEQEGRLIASLEHEAIVALPADQ